MGTCARARAPRVAIFFSHFPSPFPRPSLFPPPPPPFFSLSLS